MESDMLLFYCDEEPHFPRERLSHQLYVHLTREAPVNTEMPGYGVYGEHINISMSYRKDGNLYAPYFTMVPRNDPQPHYKTRLPFHKRNKTVVWMVSNCHADSRRDLYVGELQKYINVDIFGLCGKNRTCDNRRSKSLYRDCFAMFERTYKFYLSFENNICTDYYTEKLLNPFEHEIVPVVFGGADYERDFPEHSVINVMDFPNPKDLAVYLNSMVEEEYDSYLQWRATYRLEYHTDSCIICEFLHNSAYTRGEQILPPSYGRNYTKWWHETCHNYLIYDLKHKGGW